MNDATRIPPVVVVAVWLSRSHRHHSNNIQNVYTLVPANYYYARVADAADAYNVVSARTHHHYNAIIRRF